MVAKAGKIAAGEAAFSRVRVLPYGVGVALRALAGWLAQFKGAVASLRGHESVGAARRD